jgi:hypothetical protein
MKKVVVFILSLGFLSAQSLEFGTVFADQSVTMLRFGGNYKFMDIKLADKKAPLHAVVAYAAGAEGHVDYSAFEFGAMGQYDLENKLYAKANVMFSILSASVSGVNIGTGLGETVETTNTEFTIELGLGYQITKELNAELSYGLTGLDGLRLNLAYSISSLLR